MKEVWVVVWFLGGCGVHTADRQACYFEADSTYFAVAHECKAKGLKYDECAPLREADKQHKEDYEACQ